MSNSIIRFYPEEVYKLVDKADVVSLFNSLAAQTTLKNQYHSFHLMWEVVYGLALACQSDSVCKKLNVRKCLDLLLSFPKFKGFKKININISYITARLSTFHNYRGDWESYLPYLVEVARTYGSKSAVSRRNLAWTLKNIDEALATNILGLEQLQDYDADLNFFNGNYDALVSCKELSKKILGESASSHIKEICLFGIHYISRHEEIQSLQPDLQKDMINLVVIE